MLKTHAIIIVFLISVTSIYAQTIQSGNSFTKLWETEPGLKTPESVLYDSITGIIYVSNVDGKPSEKDSNGFISMLSSDGKILKIDWVTGIDAPKGMGILNNHLFVSNIDEVIEIDIPTAIIVKRYSVKGSKFLNDIAIDIKTGMIFITDSGTGQVYVLLNGSVNLWLQGEMFNGANGLCLRENILYIGTGNSILQANIKTGEVLIWMINTGGVDGLFMTSENKFIYSDWTGSVFLASQRKKPELLLNTSALKINAADFGVCLSENRILIPTFTNNKVMCYTSERIK